MDQLHYLNCIKGILSIYLHTDHINELISLLPFMFNIFALGLVYLFPNHIPIGPFYITRAEPVITTGNDDKTFYARNHRILISLVLAV